MQSYYENSALTLRGVNQKNQVEIPKMEIGSPFRSSRINHQESKEIIDPNEKIEPKEEILNETKDPSIVPEMEL
jgi:hypothetical protein